jgi:hypothetical protein
MAKKKKKAAKKKPAAKKKAPTKKSKKKVAKKAKKKAGKKVSDHFKPDPIEVSGGGLRCGGDRALVAIPDELKKVPMFKRDYRYIEERVAAAVTNPEKFSLTPPGMKALPAKRITDTGPGGVYVMEAACVCLTPRAAGLVHNIYNKFNRQACRRHTEALKGIIEANQFRNDANVCLAWFPDGTIRVLNGAHSLSAIAQGDKNVHVLMTWYAVKDEAHAVRVFLSADTIRKRSVLEQLRIMDMPKKVGISGVEFKTFVEACRKFVNGHVKNGGTCELSKSPLMLSVVMTDYANAARSYFRAIQHAKGFPQTMLMKSPIAAVGIETFQYQPAKAKEFWGRVATDQFKSRGVFAATFALLEEASKWLSRYEWHAHIAAWGWNQFSRKFLDAHGHRLQSLDSIRKDLVSKLEGAVGSCRAQVQPPRPITILGVEDDGKLIFDGESVPRRYDEEFFSGKYLDRVPL